MAAIDILPDEMLDHVFQFVLPAQVVFCCAEVCRRWAAVVYDMRNLEIDRREEVLYTGKEEKLRLLKLTDSHLGRVRAPVAIVNILPTLPLTSLAQSITKIQFLPSVIPGCKYLSSFTDGIHPNTIDAVFALKNLEHLEIEIPTLSVHANRLYEAFSKLRYIIVFARDYTAMPVDVRRCIVDLLATQKPLYTPTVSPRPLCYRWPIVGTHLPTLDNLDVTFRNPSKGYHNVKVTGTALSGGAAIGADNQFLQRVAEGVFAVVIPIVRDVQVIGAKDVIVSSNYDPDEEISRNVMVETQEYYLCDGSTQSFSQSIYMPPVKFFDVHDQLAAGVYWAGAFTAAVARTDGLVRLDMKMRRMSSWQRTFHIAKPQRSVSVAVRNMDMFDTDKRRLVFY